MPPRPRHPSRSKLGKCFAISSGSGGFALGVPCEPVSSTVNSVCVARFTAIRQRGHNPAGEFAGRGSPHCGETDVVSLMTVTYRSPNSCYRAVLISQLREGIGQMAHFSIEIRLVRKGLRDFLAIQLAKPLAQPMHRYACGAFADTQSCRSRSIIDGCMRDGQKTFEHSKFTCLAGRLELGRQAINGKFEQCKSPLTVENCVGGN